MRMVPKSPYATGSQAEKLIFERLRLALSDRFVALHSLKPTNHPYKRFPEIDFVICGPEGLYVLEVKGGRVACREGVWEYRDRNDQVSHSQEGPFRQAETALRGLRATLDSGLPTSLLDPVTTGYGVLFPDCDWHEVGAEWERPMLADRRGSRDMAGWLQGLFEYWQARGQPGKQLDDGSVAQIVSFLRPQVDASENKEAVPLRVSVRDASQRIEWLTEDQMRMADVAEANPRVLCSGGAGTGKTFLAERLARCWADSGLKVALVCRSAWLRHFLASRLSMPGLTVSLIGGLHLDRQRAGLQRFDALIVDEGQDLFDGNSLEALDRALAGGLDTGRWCWFHDLNNQSLTADFDQQAKNYLESLDPVRMPLRINCRNTRTILEWIQDALGADLGTRGAGSGPEVRQHSAGSRKDAAACVAREISELVDVGGLAPGSVTVLSPFDYGESCLAEISSEAAGRIRRLDEYSMRRTSGDKVGFARIDQFKGLENESIIVIDLPAPDEHRGGSAAHYVAMSRARSVLSLIHRAGP